MSYYGSTKIGRMFLGGTEIAKAYLGSDLVFQKGQQPTPQPQQYTATFDISSYDTTDYSWYSQSNIANAYAGSTSTNYAQINYKRGSGAETWVYFKFDTSSIPAGATIDEVSCSVKCMTNGNATILPTRTVQMFTGTTAKGSASSMPTSAGTRSFSGTSWTLSELRDARVKVRGVRGTSQVNTNYYCRIYGATLTVKYTV